MIARETGVMDWNLLYSCFLGQIDQCLGDHCQLRGTKGILTNKPMRKSKDQEAPSRIQIGFGFALHYLDVRPSWSNSILPHKANWNATEGVVNTPHDAGV